MALTHDVLEEIVVELNELSIEREARGSATIKIIVSFTVAKDYESRGVFADLRPQNAVKNISGRGYVYAVTRRVAAEIYDDACAQGKLPGDRATRGRKIAYGALRSALIGLKVNDEPSQKMKDLWAEADRAIQPYKDKYKDRRAWLAKHRPYQPAIDAPRGNPNLSVAESCTLPAPPGFEDYAVIRIENWRETSDRRELEKRVDDLWTLWLAFLGARCPFRDSDPEWTHRYEGPDVWDLAYRMPELVAQHRRRFGTSYCRLVCENGREVKAWMRGIAL